MCIACELDHRAIEEGVGAQPNTWQVAPALNLHCADQLGGPQMLGAAARVRGVVGTPCALRADARHARITEAGVTSALLERPKSRGNRGPQIACNTSAHGGESVRDVCGFFVSEYTPWSRASARASRAQAWLRVLV